jgi:hypothetical protein
MDHANAYENHHQYTNREEDKDVVIVEYSRLQRDLRIDGQQGHTHQQEDEQPETIDLWTGNESRAKKMRSPSSICGSVCVCVIVCVVVCGNVYITPPTPQLCSKPANQQQQQSTRTE